MKLKRAVLKIGEPTYVNNDIGNAKSLVRADDWETHAQKLAPGTVLVAELEFDQASRMLVVRALEDPEKGPGVLTHIPIERVECVQPAKDEVRDKWLVELERELAAQQEMEARLKEPEPKKPAPKAPKKPSRKPAGAGRPKSTYEGDEVQQPAPSVQAFGEALKD
jgi:hypothetical protein